MTKTFYATFDGHVLPEQESEKKPKQRALQRILARAQDLGVSDLAEQHDHYLYGTEKR